MDVSIIIVNYNTYNLVIDCIDSIYKNTSNVEFEIIVVDNDSPDRKIENLPQRFSSVKLIINHTNSGFGAANNLGAQAATGEYLFFLNPDTVLYNNAIYILHNFMLNNHGTGACGGNLLTKDYLPNTSYSNFMPGFIHEIDFFLFNVLSKIVYNGENFNHSGKNKPVGGFVSGADLMIKADLFSRLKGFDEDFFMYYEETELIYRIRKLNFEIFSVPQAKIVHYEGGSEGIKEKTFERMKNSELLYYNKTGQKYMIYVSFYLRIIRFSITAFLYSSIGQKSKAEILKNMIHYLKKYRNF